MDSQLQISNLLAPLDWVVFGAVLGLTFLAVYWGHRKKKKNLTASENFLDLLLMGRGLTLPLFTATLVATWYGGIFGVTQIAFEEGVYNFITQGVFWYLTYLIFAIFLVKKIRNSKATTLPDMVHKLFGQKSSHIAAFFNLFNIIPIAYAISIGVFLQSLTGGDLTTMIFLGLSCSLLYSLWGGFRAVVYSDLIQFFVMCSAVFLVLVFSFQSYGGVNFLIERLPPTHFSITGKNSIGQTLVWGFIALFTLVDPNFYHRCFAAKSSRVAKNGILISTLIWFLFDICTTAGAMYARAVMPETNSATAYMTYAVNLLPTGLKGFFLAGILATILSTLDSYLFLAGTTLSYDILIKKFPSLNKTSALIHHLSTVGVALFAGVLAILFKGNIKNVWLIFGSYSASCLLLPLLFGMAFPKQISDRQFFFTSLLTAIIISFKNWLPLGFSEVQELYLGLLFSTLLLSSFLVMDKAKVLTRS